MIDEQTERSKVIPSYDGFVCLISLSINLEERSSQILARIHRDPLSIS